MTGTKVAPAQDTLVAVLQERAGMTRSAAAFGESIVRASLLETAQLIKEGKAERGVAEFTARVVVRFVPDPNNIDVHFEECIAIGRQTAMQCYIESNAPRPPALKHR